MRPARSACVRAVRLALALLCSASAAPDRAWGAAPAEATAAVAHPYAAHVAEASQRFGIPEVWIWRVMHVESRGKPRALSHAGAMGLMQIMPATWSMLTTQHRLGSDPFDMRANILAGAAYLRAMWDRYRDVRLMLAAYNAGPGRADAYAAGRRGLPAETVAYVAAIAPALGAPAAPSAAMARTAELPSWRGASLFAGQRSDTPAATSAQRGDGPTASPSHSAPAPSPLFVPLSGNNR
jgi:soluble lytic murein transglycosylase-like protein